MGNIIVVRFDSSHYNYCAVVDTLTELQLSIQQFVNDVLCSTCYCITVLQARHVASDSGRNFEDIYFPTMDELGNTRFDAQQSPARIRIPGVLLAERAEQSQSMLKLDKSCTIGYLMTLSVNIQPFQLLISCSETWSCSFQTC